VKKSLVSVVLLLLACNVFFGQGAGPRKRLVYCDTELLVDGNVAKLEKLFARAAKAGYNGVVLSDSKFGNLAAMPPRYFENVGRVKKFAAADGLEIIPMIFPMGYSGSILCHNPNLAEGLPVRDALFEARGGVMRQVADPPVEFKGADLKDFSGWREHDPLVKAVDGAAVMADPQGRPCRMMQTITVHPFRQYHISVLVKTTDFTGIPRVMVHSAKNKELNYAGLGVKKTQDWTLRNVVFNSLDNDKVDIYFGCWDDGKTGTLAWKDPKIEETAFVNLVRRAGAPLDARTEDGHALEEGKDFDKIIDPKMGNVPWSGEYQVWHTPPVVRTKLADGARVRFSFYHALPMNDGQVMICPSEPETAELLRDQAQRVHAAWGAKGYFMAHDEIRVLNRDKSCTDRHMTPGEILADNLRTCTGILRKVNPGGDIYVWSDMFDPKHNAHGSYFLVDGDYAGSWKGLDKDVIIAIWGYQEREEGLAWFAGLGNRVLIAGYYDKQPERIRDWLDSAKKCGAEVSGVMYTTWQDKYDDLETYAGFVDGGR